MVLELPNSVCSGGLFPRLGLGKLYHTLVDLLVAWVYIGANRALWLRFRWLHFMEKVVRVMCTRALWRRLV